MAKAFAIVDDIEKQTVDQIFCSCSFWCKRVWSFNPTGQIWEHKDRESMLLDFVNHLAKTKPKSFRFYTQVPLPSEISNKKAKKKKR